MPFLTVRSKFMRVLPKGPEWKKISIGSQDGVWEISGNYNKEEKEKE